MIYNRMIKTFKFKNMYPCFIVLFVLVIHNNRVYSEQTSVIKNKEILTVSSEDIKKSIFKYNFEAIKEQFKDDVEKSISRENKSQDLKIGKIKNSIPYNLNLYKNSLNKIIENTGNKDVISESYFKLALVSFEENNNNFKDSSYYLKKAIENLNENNETLYVKENLFAGNLYYIAEKFSESSKFFKKANNYITKISHKGAYKIEHIRSLMGIGDCSFAQFNFLEAAKTYQLAQKIIDTESVHLISQSQYAVLGSALSLRLVLSYYHEGDYEKSLEVLKSYAYVLADNTQDKPAELLNELKRIGGILLFELKNKQIFQSMAADGLYGDFGKEVILNSFSEYIQAGETKFIADVAQSIQTQFYQSVLYPEFMQAWILTHATDTDKESFFEVQSMAVTNLEKSSLWSKKFTLEGKKEKLRHDLILKYASVCANFYFNLGIKNNYKPYFVASAQVYRAWIEERPAPEQRGEILHNYAEALFRAHDLQKAHAVILDSLTYQCDDLQLKSRLFLKIKITYSLSESEQTTHTKKYLDYEAAVDEFIHRFPQDAQAHMALFESAQRAQTRGDLKDAIKRYETLLNYASLNNSPATTAEKEKILKSLSSVLNNSQNKDRENSLALEGLESYSRQIDSSPATKKLLETSNWEVAFRYFTQLSADGKLPQAASFLSSWAQNNKENSHSAQYYLESIKVEAQLQNWKKVYELSLNFNNIYPKSERVNESYYWLAKAQDNLLLFREAALSYEKSAKLNAPYPSFNEKIFALNRAVEITGALQLIPLQAALCETKADLQIYSKVKIGAAEQSLLTAASLYFKAGNKLKAKALYEKLISLKDVTPASKRQAHIGVFLAELSSKNNNSREIDALIEKDTALQKNSVQNLNSNFLRDTILVLNQIDTESFFQAKKSLYEKVNESTLKKMERWQEAVEKRANYLNLAGAQKDLIVQTYLLSAQMCELMSETFVYLSHKTKKSDDYLKRSQQYQTFAKRIYYSVLSLPALEVNDKSTVYVQSQTVFSTQEGMSVFPLVDESTFYQDTASFLLPSSLEKGE